MPRLTATAVPAGRIPDGLPVGVQLIAPMPADRTALMVAELPEQTVAHLHPPDHTPTATPPDV